MEGDIALLILCKMFGFNDYIDTDKGRDLIEEAIRRKENATKELAELIGCDKASVEKAINSLRETLAKQAEENGVSIDAIIDGTIS